MNVYSFICLSFIPGMISFLRPYSRRPYVFAKYMQSPQITVASEHSKKIFETPKLDGREYHQIILDNGIRVTLVRDVVSEKASAALSVRTGAANDPIEYPGMAHFTEHVRLVILSQLYSYVLF